MCSWGSPGCDGGPKQPLSSLMPWVGPAYCISQTVTDPCPSCVCVDIVSVWECFVRLFSSVFPSASGVCLSGESVVGHRRTSGQPPYRPTSNQQSGCPHKRPTRFAVEGGRSFDFIANCWFLGVCGVRDVTACETLAVFAVYEDLVVFRLVLLQSSAETLLFFFVLSETLYHVFSVSPVVHLNRGGALG